MASSTWSSSARWAAVRRGKGSDVDLLLDRGGFFAGVLAGLRARLLELGSRRVRMPDGSWYWDLRPGMKHGEVVEI